MFFHLSLVRQLFLDVRIVIAGDSVCSHHPQAPTYCCSHCCTALELQQVDFFSTLVKVEVDPKKSTRVEVEVAPKNLLSSVKVESKKLYLK